MSGLMETMYGLATPIVQRMDSFFSPIALPLMPAIWNQDSIVLLRGLIRLVVLNGSALLQT